jgi:hypothetical protein
MKLDSTTLAILILGTAGIAAFTIYRMREKEDGDGEGGAGVQGNPELATIPVLSELDVNMPAAEAEAVSIAMATETSPANLMSFGNSLLPNFPIAAEMLKTKASIVSPGAEAIITEQQVRKGLLAELAQLKGGT